MFIFYTILLHNPANKYNHCKRKLLYLINIHKNKPYYRLMQTKIKKYHFLHCYRYLIPLENTAFRKKNFF